MVAEAKLFARGCERESGALLPWVGTRNAARDTDVLRAALGDTKLTYLGKSYGTYLGTWYAQLFPSHVRALVLDGAIDPGSSSLRMNIVQGQGFEVALRAFVADCVARAPVGRGPVAAGLARIQGLISRAAARPLVNNLSGQRADGALVLNGIATALYSQAYWPTLREALASAFRGDATVLVELANALWERNATGQYTNLADANMAVNCLDRPWPGGGPAGLARWRAAAASAERAAPASGRRSCGAACRAPTGRFARTRGRRSARRAPRRSWSSATSGTRPLRTAGRRPWPGTFAPGCCWGGMATGTPRTCGGVPAWTAS